MGYNNNTPKQSYSASASQTIFDFNFKIFDSSDVLVYQTLSGNSPSDSADILTETTHYTVSDITDNGFRVTLVTGAGINDVILGQRAIPISRDTDYQQGGDMLSATLDDDQDLQTYLIADQDQTNKQAIRLPNTAIGIETQLPDVVPDAFLGWNSAGDALINNTSVLDSVNAAAESAAAALVSENNASTSETNAGTSETNSSASATLADKYANEAEDVEVTTGKYSAYHWSEKAKDNSGGSALGTATDTTNFNGNLSASDTDVQKALDTLDNLSGSVASHFSTVAVGGTEEIGGTIATKGLLTHLETGTGASNPINLGVGLIDFTTAFNGSGYYLDRTTNQIKNDAGTVQDLSTPLEIALSNNAFVGRVAIKGRDDTSPPLANCGLTGANSTLRLDNSSAEIINTERVKAYSSNGITLGTNTAVNNNTKTYVIHTEVCQIIRCSLTSTGTIQVYAYNPIVGNFMRYRVGFTCTCICF